MCLGPFDEMLYMEPIPCVILLITRYYHVSPRRNNYDCVLVLLKKNVFLGTADYSLHFDHCYKCSCHLNLSGFALFSMVGYLCVIVHPHCSTFFTLIKGHDVSIKID